MNSAGHESREEFTVAPDGQPMHLQPAWRRDFPIDAVRDQYVERRELMKFLVLTSLAFTVGQFWIAARAWLWRRSSAGEYRIASVNDLAVGSSLIFHYPTPTDSCVLVRLAENRFVAYDQRCTHLSCAVIPRPDLGELQCPCHHGVFDLESGRPLAGPPRRPLPQITIEIRRGAVYATGVRRRTV